MLGIYRPMPRCRDENPNAGGSEPAGQRGTSQSGMSQRGTSQPGMSQRGTSQPGMPQRKRAAKEALLRLLLTPTFAVGIGTVVAAVLAYGTTQTHLLFSGLGPACGAANCATTAPHRAGGGEPMRISATPTRGRTGGPARGGQGRQDGGASADPDLPPASGNHPPARTGTSGPGVSITYQTLGSGHGEFLGAITITNRTGSALAGWRLWLRYSEGWIDRVQGARWLPASPYHSNAGLATARPGQVLGPAASIRITVWVQGQPSEPSVCAFNGTSCSYSGRSETRPGPA